mmetsp:Transcript_51062/g.114995  ORF Transcript_51062/g.114995 Transcript_51062/m.114995 type:complete len:711 (+) Transcript_51062:67-2199(+)
MGVQAADGNHENAIFKEIADIEAEALMWRFRCLRAEAQLRIQKQLRRRNQGGLPPRWPEDTEGLMKLRKAKMDLEAEVKVLEAGRAKPLRNLVVARISSEAAGNRLKQKLEDIQEDSGCGPEAHVLELSNSLDLLSASWEIEDAQASLGNITRDEDRIAELLQREADLREELAEATKGQAKLFEELEAERPRLKELASEAESAARVLQHAQSVANKRATAVTGVENGNAEVLESLEKRLLSEQMQLEDCRTELRDVDQNTLEATEQAKKARLGHGHQLELVRHGGAALREALADSQQEYNDRSKEVVQLRTLVDDLAAKHNQRLAVEKNMALTSAELEGELHKLVSQLGSLKEEHDVSSKDSAEATSELSASLSRCHAATEEHIATLAVSEKALGALGTCESRMDRFTSEFGADAQVQRSELMERASQGAIKLKEDIAAAAKRCDEARGANPEKDCHRDRLLLAKQASLEVLGKLKASYGEFTKDVRFGCKQGGWTDVAGNASKALRRIGRNLDDLMRFLDAEASWAAQVVEQPEPKSEDVGGESDAAQRQAAAAKLPQCLLEAYANANDRGPKAVWLEEMLTAEKQKVQMFQKKNAHASKAHEAEMRQLVQQTEDLSSQLARVELDFAESLNHGKTTQACLEAELLEAFRERAHAQLRSVEEVQQQLWSTVEAPATEQAPGHQRELSEPSGTAKGTIFSFWDAALDWPE